MQSLLEVYVFIFENKKNMKDLRRMFFTVDKKYKSNWAFPQYEIQDTILCQPYDASMILLVPWGSNP